MKITCPICNYDQLTSNQTGFSAKKALGGALLLGDGGLLAGFHGSKVLTITCLACGNQFKAGEGKIIYDTPEEEATVTQNLEAAKINLQHQKDSKSANGVVVVFVVIIILVVIFALAVSK